MKEERGGEKKREEEKGKEKKIEEEGGKERKRGRQMKEVVISKEINKE